MNTIVCIPGSFAPESIGGQLAAACRARQIRIRQIGTNTWETESAVDRYRLLRALLPLTRKEGVVIALPQAASARRAMLFDLDSTLTACEFLDTLAEAAGFDDRTRRQTRAAMEGHADFAENYRERVARFAGMPVARIETIIDRLPLAAGASELFERLREAHIPTAIVTGGYARVGRAVQQRLGAEALYATELEEAGGRLTGRIAGPLLDAAAKVAALDDFCAKHQLQRCDCVAVGDGANDLQLLAAAGCGILYTACPENSEPLPIGRLLDF